MNRGDGSIQGSESNAASTITEEEVGTAVERQSVLWLTNVSHRVNHFQNTMVAVLYAVIMPDLGFSYADLGILTAVRSILAGATQGLYGFATPFIPRAWLLGIGNIVLGVGMLLTGFTQNFGGFLGARAVASAGASAQHPVGYSLLAGYFPKARGTIIALNSSISNIGSLLAPLAAAALLLIIGWRQILFIVAFLSIAMGMIYFLFRKRVAPGTEQASTSRGKLLQGRASYGRVLRNKNMIMVSLVMMVGGAGRDVGVNIAYLGPHFANDFDMSTTMVGVAISAMQAGGVIGPIALGWISDRVSRTAMIQVSLAMSAVATVWLAFQGAYLPFLLLNLVFYGIVTRSRMTLTQAMVADSLPDEDRDAAFSVFFFLGFLSAPFWAILVGS